MFGCLIGLIFADAVGSRFEGIDPVQIRSQFNDKLSAFEYASNRGSLRYTDDGQMALAIAEHLAENTTIDSKALMKRFVKVYEPWRGYGRGARVLIESFRDKADYEFMAEHLFPGGSLGNDVDIEQFGNGIEAHESVVTALACFALNPQDYQKAVATAIWQGGDTDTIGAMTGALVGAHIGPGFSTGLPIELLEEGQEFIRRVRDLADRLAD